jgi:hypothetical protein
MKTNYQILGWTPLDEIFCVTRPDTPSMMRDGFEAESLDAPAMLPYGGLQRDPCGNVVPREGWDVIEYWF